jgi:hypothetical protein
VVTQVELAAQDVVAPLHPEQSERQDDPHNQPSEQEPHPETQALSALQVRRYPVQPEQPDTQVQELSHASVVPEQEPQPDTQVFEFEQP